LSNNSTCVLLGYLTAEDVKTALRDACEATVTG
jgi:hypothetical protein